MNTEIEIAKIIEENNQAERERSDALINALHGNICVSVTADENLPKSTKEALIEVITKGIEFINQTK